MWNFQKFLLVLITGKLSRLLAAISLILIFPFYCSYLSIGPNFNMKIPTVLSCCTFIAYFYTFFIFFLLFYFLLLYFFIAYCGEWLPFFTFFSSLSISSTLLLYCLYLSFIFIHYISIMLSMFLLYSIQFFIFSYSFYFPSILVLL